MLAKPIRKYNADCLRLVSDWRQSALSFAAETRRVLAFSLFSYYLQIFIVGDVFAAHTLEMWSFKLAVDEFAAVLL